MLSFILVHRNILLSSIWSGNPICRNILCQYATPFDFPCVHYSVLRQDLGPVLLSVSRKLLLSGIRTWYSDSYFLLPKSHVSHVFTHTHKTQTKNKHKDKQTQNYHHHQQKSFTFKIRSLPDTGMACLRHSLWHSNTCIAFRLCHGAFLIACFYMKVPRWFPDWSPVSWWLQLMFQPSV